MMFSDVTAEASASLSSFQLQSIKVVVSGRSTLSRFSSHFGRLKKKYVPQPQL